MPRLHTSSVNGVFQVNVVSRIDGWGVVCLRVDDFTGRRVIPEHGLPLAVLSDSVELDGSLVERLMVVIVWRYQNVLDVDVCPASALAVLRAASPRDGLSVGAVLAEIKIIDNYGSGSLASGVCGKLRTEMIVIVVWCVHAHWGYTAVSQRMKITIFTVVVAISKPFQISITIIS